MGVGSGVNIGVGLGKSCNNNSYEVRSGVDSKVIVGVAVIG